MSAVPKECLGPVSLSSHSSDQLCSLGLATSPRPVLDSSTSGTDASNGIKNQGVESKPQAQLLPEACDCAILYREELSVSRHVSSVPSKALPLYDPRFTQAL